MCPSKLNTHTIKVQCFRSRSECRLLHARQGTIQVLLGTASQTAAPYTRPPSPCHAMSTQSGPVYRPWYQTKHIPLVVMLDSGRSIIVYLLDTALLVVNMHAAAPESKQPHPGCRLPGIAQSTFPLSSCEALASAASHTFWMLWSQESLYGWLPLASSRPTPAAQTSSFHTHSRASCRQAPHHYHIHLVYYDVSLFHLVYLITITIRLIHILTPCHLTLAPLLT